MSRYAYFMPNSFQEAWKLLGDHPDAKFIAGGTDLMTRIKAGELRTSALISLRSIPGLNGVEQDQTIKIGAATSITDLIQSPLLQDRAPVLVEAGRRLDSIQIRNLATVGGNLCNASPCADTAPPLLVLDARVRIRAPQGSRDEKLVDFFKGPGEAALGSGEILECVFFDLPSENAKAAFYKKGRVRMDLAIASVAVLLDMQEERCVKARLAAGSVAPIPMRLREVERLLEGKIISKQLVAGAQKLAAKSVSPITDVRSTEEYRRHILGVYVKRGLESILGWSE